jgi:cytidine deaminase
MSERHLCMSLTRRKFLYSAMVTSSTLLFHGQARRAEREISAALKPFDTRSRRLLLDTVDSDEFRGQIPSHTVKEMMRVEGKGADELMLALLPLARTCSRPPLSNYFVGAVSRGASGAFYIGANIEVPGQSLGLAVHAEQASTANAYMCGEDGVTAIAVTAAPCGHCRQFLYEMSPAGAMRILVAGKEPTSLSVLLPSAFGPVDLGRNHGAFPIEETSLSLTPRSSDPLILASWQAARRSYAPYSLSHSGVAIAASARRIFAGSYIENVAFNPSLSPLQCALAGLLAAGQPVEQITRAVLVESVSAKISQEAVTRAALSSLAPAARLDIVKAG